MYYEDLPEELKTGLSDSSVAETSVLERLFETMDTAVHPAAILHSRIEGSDLNVKEVQEAERAAKTMQDSLLNEYKQLLSSALPQYQGYFPETMMKLVSGMETKDLDHVFSRASSVLSHVETHVLRAKSICKTWHSVDYAATFKEITREISRASTEFSLFKDRYRGISEIVKATHMDTLQGCARILRDEIAPTGTSTTMI
ncbi:hypothetical protein OBBRIDRAFT_860534 [Obba rivulosa]|uniref:Uncharacterized protein n=1 Tax=Obba rivulosa TaxID=1052685 RepID=A0A8E2AIF4_9APHY|nr:hypothetical protein OBBRIDRAFT_860534 [Obba rivulosa]